MNPIDELPTILKKLRFSGLLETLQIRIDQACDEKLSHPEFLYRLFHDELERREAKQLGQRLRRAAFEHQKSLEDFDFSFNPSIPKNKIVDLSTCAFIRKHENIALCGQTGVGKSHLAQAIGHRACSLGHSVLFLCADDLLAKLRAARGDHTYDRKLASFLKPDLLILDDLGLRSLSANESLDLYEIIRGRYEKGSLIITSNRALEEWPPLFGDALLAEAGLDRFLHHAHKIEISGNSYRNPPKKRRPARSDSAKTK